MCLAKSVKGFLFSSLINVYILTTNTKWWSDCSLHITLQCNFEIKFIINYRILPVRSDIQYMHLTYIHLKSGPSDSAKNYYVCFIIIHIQYTFVHKLFGFQIRWPEKINFANYSNHMRAITNPIPRSH